MQIDLFNKDIVPLVRCDRLSLIVEILQVYNCRVSEILSAAYSNLVPGSHLILRGAKHSRDIVIRDRALLTAIAAMHPIHPRLIFYPVKYYQVYQFIKTNYSQLFTLKFKGKNKKVTHYFRYKNASKVSTVSDAALILHHNSHQSAKFYNKNLKEA